MLVEPLLALSWLDWLFIGAYLFVLAAVTLWVRLRPHYNTVATEDFFLGGRDVSWWAIGLSLFASNLGTDHLVGLAGSGAASGLSVGSYEWSATYTLVILGWVFVPHYLKARIFTTPEYLEKRFSPSLRTAFTWLTLASILLTKVSVTLFAGGVIMRVLFGWNIYISVAVLLTITALYTSVGGLGAVMYTEVLQAALLFVGSFVLLYYGMQAVGGWEGLREKLPEEHFHLLHDMDHPEYPWLGVLVGMPIASIWYWCTDQVMVQRTLATREEPVAKRGTVFAGWLKITPMFTMVLPGLIAAALFPDEIAKDSNQAYVLLVIHVLPAGWIGVMVAVILCSFMASLASCFNSSSTLVTMDLYRRAYPDASEESMVWVGRLATVVMAVLSFLWVPVIDQTSSQLFLYIQSVSMIWAGPVAVVFLAAVCSERVTDSSVKISAGVGVTMGVVFWLMQNVYYKEMGQSELGDFIRNFNFLLYAIFSAVVTGVILVICVAVEELLSGMQRAAPDDETKPLSARLTRCLYANWAAGTLILTVAILTAIFA